VMKDSCTRFFCYNAPRVLLIVIGKGESEHASPSSNGLPALPVSSFKALPAGKPRETRYEVEYGARVRGLAEREARRL
jgi:hypothetical protein